MDTITLKCGFEGKIIRTLTRAHGDIRPPHYNLDGAIVLKGVNGWVGYVTILPPDITEVLYCGEVLHSELTK